MNVTEQDYELLSRYIDRELPEAQVRQLEQRLANEASLRKGLSALQNLQRQLQDVYSGLADEPVPQRIRALLQDGQTGTADIVQLPHRRIANWGFALAASLVVAVSAVLVSQSGQRSGQAGADPLLSAALDSAPSSGETWENLADGRTLRPVLSFRHSAGNWCREYLLTSAEGDHHGVACRGDSGWDTLVLVDIATVGSSTEYRPAGAADSLAVADFIDANAADIALDAGQEAELIARQWQ